MKESGQSLSYVSGLKVLLWGQLPESESSQVLFVLSGTWPHRASRCVSCVGLAVCPHSSDQTLRSTGQDLCWFWITNSDSTLKVLSSYLFCKWILKWERTEKSTGTIQVRISSWLKQPINRLSVSKVLSECGHSLIRLKAEKDWWTSNISIPSLQVTPQPSPKVSIWVSKQTKMILRKTKALGRKDYTLYHWLGLFVQTLVLMWPLDKCHLHSTH